MVPKERTPGLGGTWKGPQSVKDKRQDKGMERRRGGQRGGLGWLQLARGEEARPGCETHPMNVYCGGACLVRPMIRMSQMAASVESRGMNLMHSLFFLKATSSAGKNKERRESIWSTGSPVSFPFRQRKGLVVHGPTAGSRVCGAAAQPFPAERGACGARRARALRQLSHRHADTRP